MIGKFVLAGLMCLLFTGCSDETSNSVLAPTEAGEAFLDVETSSGLQEFELSNQNDKSLFACSLPDSEHLELKGSIIEDGQLESFYQDMRANNLIFGINMFDNTLAVKNLLDGNPEQASQRMVETYIVLDGQEYRTQSNQTCLIQYSTDDPSDRLVVDIDCPQLSSVNQPTENIGVKGVIFCDKKLFEEKLSE